MSGFIVIGPGRAGRSFAAALEARGWRNDGILGRDDDVADAATRTDVVLLTVRDEVIADVAADVAPGTAAVLHVSGATGLEVLHAHPRRGSVHPLMSLPDPTEGARRLLSGIAFAVDGDPAARSVAEALGGRPFVVPDDRRALYHATAAVAANHLVALLAQVERLADAVGVAPAAYWDLAAATFEGVRRTGAVSSLTGPAARGDLVTLRRHLDALPTAERDLYAILATEAARIAGRDVDLDPSHASGSDRERRSDRGGGRAMTTVGSPTVVSTVAELRAVLDGHRGAGRQVGFVPTMGYLHDGHGSLMAAASAANDITVASIFVNPLQFAPNEDLSSYPRDLERDAAVAAANGVDVLFTPTVEEMYPNGQVLTTVSVAGLSEAWDGASRPSHFAGVATVVSKLFNIVGPCRAYFGEKDFQQLAIITRMAADLSIPVDVIGCPIVREPDGLAMSSRNIYLDGPSRAAAVVLRRALDEGERIIAEGETDPAAVDAAMAAVVHAEPLAELDYVAAVDAADLTQPERLVGEVRLLAAVRFGSTRLIDNCGVTVDPAEPIGAA